MAFKEIINFPKLPIRFFTVDSEKISNHPHWHGALEILYIKKGTALQQIDENTINIRENDFVIIGSNQFHSTYSKDNSKCVIVVLQIQLDSFLPSFAPEALLNSLSEIHFFDKIESDLIIREIKKIIKIIENNNDFFAFELMAGINNFFKLLLEEQHNLPITNLKSLNNNYRIIANKIFDFIDENYEYEITLNQAASHVNLSVSHFLRVFRIISGKSFKKYLNIYRIKKSLIFLREGDNITETALKCGFPDVNTFIRNFKQYYNSTPGKFAK